MYYGTSTALWYVINDLKNIHLIFDDFKEFKQVSNIKEGMIKYQCYPV